MLKIFLLTLCLGLVANNLSVAGADADSALLRTLRPVHPRLLVLDDQLAAVKELIQTNAVERELYQQLLTEGERILHEPPQSYQIAGPEHTLLDVSREVERRVWLLAGLYRINGDARFAARARDEMLSAAQFPDWYPKHFLDTAEMTAALGVGYDWLFHYLSPAERLTIRQAIVSKGLEPGLAGLSADGRLSRLHNNWVQVCNGGLLLGALAIADEEPAKSAQLLELSRAPMARIMELFAPDGGFEEGPVYWNYATAYNIYYLAALDTALGTDFGLSQAKGFDLTGNYRMQTIGPIGKLANFGDASEQVSCAPQMLWMARRFNRPEYALHEHAIRDLAGHDFQHNQSSRFAIMELLWDRTEPASLTETNLPVGAKFDRIATAFFRSAWGDTNAIYAGFKGGSNHASHGHLDLGTFILDAFGERWAVDLGPDSYGLPGYFGRQRWSYYRLRTEGHNTLTVGGQNEDLDASAPVTVFASDPERSQAILDLHAAYPQPLTDWRRGIRMLDRRQVVVQDELAARKPVEVVWHLHTRAAIKIGGHGTEALLSQGNSKLLVRILSPLPATFEVVPVNIPVPQRPAPGVCDLEIRLAQLSAKTTIAVLLQSPDDTMPVPPLTPLSQWQ